MEQPSFFHENQHGLYVGVPHNGIETSIEAALSYLPQLGADEARVLKFVASNDGAICDEVEAALGMKHQTASARLNGLEQKKCVIRTGERRRTRSNRWALVYRVNPPRRRD